MNFLEKIVVDETTIASDIVKALIRSQIVHVVPSSKIENIENYYYDISKGIGELFCMEEDLTTGNKVGEFWTDIKYDLSFTNSFRHSNKRQPFHTDGSYESNAPDISFFYCLQKAKYGGSTIFVDRHTIIDCLSIYDPELLQILQSKEFLFSKGNDYKSKRVITEQSFNWNYFRIEKSESSERFHDFLERFIFDGGLYTSINLNLDEAVFFWDEKMLHGRTSFLGQRWLRKGGIRWNRLEKNC